MSRFAGTMRVQILSVLLLLSSSLLHANADDLVLCTPVDPRGVDFFEYVKLGFDRIHQGMKYVYVPVERCHIDANDGYYDGICATIEGIDDDTRYSSLIKVPYVLAKAKCLLWAIKSDIDVNDITDINELDDYRVGYIRGIKVIESILGKRMALENYIDVSSHEQAFQMLLNDRIDVVLDIMEFGRLELKKPKFSNAGIRESRKQFGSKSVHIYLHKRHADLVPVISNALEELESEGVYERVMGISPPE